jgi:hypothetical protein
LRLFRKVFLLLFLQKKKALLSFLDLMRVIIHIGPQKTGTSYMQRRLYQYRDRLDRHGIAYHLPPLTQAVEAGGPRPHFSDIGVLLAHGGFERFAGELALVRENRMETLVISTEYLSKLRVDQIKPLAALLTGDQVEIYAYCRRWSDRLPSAWWQRVSTGYGVPFPEWLERTLAEATQNWLVNESLLWQRWARIFGRERIHILSYDVLVEAGQDLADDFIFERLRYDGRALGPPKRREAHVRPVPLEVEVVRNLYRAADAQRFNLTSRIKHRMLEKLREDDMEPFRGMAGGKLLSVTIDDNDPVFAPSLAAMQGWSDRLVTANISPAFMRPQAKATKVVPPEALAGPEAQAAFAAMMVGAEKLAELPPPTEHRPKLTA